MDIAKRNKQFYCADNKIIFEIWSCEFKKRYQHRFAKY